MAQDHDRSLAWLILFRKQEPAVEGSRPEEMEQARRREQSLHPLRLVETEKRAAATLRDGHLFERSVLRPEVDVLPWRGPVLRDVDSGGSQPEHREAIGIRVGKRFQQERVDHAEDRGVRADPDRQRGDDHEGDARASSQGANGVADVLHESRHESEPPGEATKIP